MCACSWHISVCVFFFFLMIRRPPRSTLFLHDALPIFELLEHLGGVRSLDLIAVVPAEHRLAARRSEEHTSELQSQSKLVCRLLLEKKKTPNHDFDPALKHTPSRHIHNLLCASANPPVL